MSLSLSLSIFLDTNLLLWIICTHTHSLSLSAQWSNWACAQVVIHTVTSVRVEALERLLAIASECCAVNNFNTAYAISAGLQSVSISRLKKTWEKLSKKSKAHQQELSTLFDVARNHRHYLDRLKRSTPPLLPYIGLFLGALS
jgi:RasGEF domain